MQNNNNNNNNKDFAKLRGNAVVVDVVVIVDITAVHCTVQL